MRVPARLCVAVIVVSALGLFASRAEGRGGWGEISTTYCYEADDGQDAYVATDNTIGNLDGEWRRSNNSDEWDGSSPMPGEGAAGGIMVETLSGEGETGGDASALSIEDASTSTSGDLNNRKMFLWRDTSAELDLARGVTLIARWRLSPEPWSAEFSNNGGTIPVPDGYYLHNANKGQLGFVQKSAVEGTITAGLMFSITDEGHLQFAQSFEGAPCAGTFFPAEDCVDVDENGWVSLWMAAMEDGAGGISVKVYLNGDLSPVIETTLTGIDADTEDAAIPETGGTASSYINLALGASGQTGAIQVDYLCAADGFSEPSSAAPACPSGLNAQVEARDVILHWTNGSKVPSAVDVLRDGVRIADDVPADPPAYKDVAPPPGDLSYELQFTVAGETCQPLKTAISICPRSLSATPTADGVLLQWANGAEYSALYISRDGADIGSAAGTATSYLDAAAPSGANTYALSVLEGTCVPLEATIVYFKPILGAGDFGTAQVTWDYELDPPPDADPGEYLLFQATANAIGCLDGMWSRGNGSDSWDGSSPGNAGDPALDVDGQIVAGAEAPGGIGLVTDGAIGAYLFEDVGDPTTAVPPATVGWLDPCNRKLFPALDLFSFFPEAAVQSFITDGFTLRARFRLTPADRAVDVADAPNGLQTNNDGKGMFTLTHDGTATGLGTSQRIGFALDVSPSMPGTGLLSIGEDANLLQVPIQDPTQWLDVWLTVIDPDPLTPEVHLELYLNGSTEPTIDIESFVPNDGGAEYDPPPGNSLYMGLGSTPDSGSMEVDLVSFVLGELPPMTGTKPRFHRGDADQNDALELTDAIQILGYLFLGTPTKVPDCLDAADADDNTTIELTDAIRILGYLFLGNSTIPDPGPTENPCGPDPGGDADHMGCDSYEPGNC